MAKREVFEKVRLESDSLNTINCLNGCMDPSWTMVILIKDCRVLLSSKWQRGAEIPTARSLSIFACSASPEGSIYIAG